VDLRQVLSVPGLQETPETHVGHAAEGTVEGTGTSEEVDDKNTSSNCLRSLR